VEDSVTPQNEAKSTSAHIEPLDPRTFTALMEQLQEGYVSSIAATAGCTIELIKKDVYGFDVRFVRPARPGVEEVTLIAQLKNTTTVKPDPSKDFFSHQLKKREYLERLAAPRTGVKAVLLVMVTAPVQEQWTEAGHECMTVRHCCYWANLEGHPVNPNVSSPTVRISTANVFTSQALADIMDRLSRGEALP
jgi:Domain of unknown function (DUF4365)